MARVWTDPRFGKGSAVKWWQESLGGRDGQWEKGGEMVMKKKAGKQHGALLKGGAEKC